MFSATASLKTMLTRVCFPATQWEYLHVLQVNFTLFFLLHLTSPGLNFSTEFLWDLRGLITVINLYRRGTYVVQHTILFLSHHHLPERANEPLTAKKKPFISCWMDAESHMWRWTGHWGLFRSLLCLFFTEELTLFPSAHHSLPTALFILLMLCWVFSPLSQLL